MVNRLVITLEQPEYSALLKKAMAELRTPQDQLRYMVRRDFGLLPADHALEDQVATCWRQDWDTPTKGFIEIEYGLEDAIVDLHALQLSTGEQTQVESILRKLVT